MERQEIFYPEQNLRLFQELLTCGSPVYSWSYDAEGTLLHTNCPDTVLDTVFTATGCKAYMLKYGRDGSAPLLLSAQLGLMWCAAFQREDGVLKYIRLIGPVLNTELSFAGIDKAIRRYDIPADWRAAFTALLQSLPVMSNVLFFQYALMLHYCVTGEKLSRSDIQFQKSREESRAGEAPAPRKDRHHVWMAEQALIRNVREGDLNYKKDLNRAGAVSRGIQVSTDTPMLQAVLTVSTFVSLCTRAAIEGGLSPEEAYSLGDSYIQSLTSCKSISELTVLGHSMYEDFIQRVRKCRTDPGLSPQIRTARDYIELHVEEELTLERLSRQVGYAPYYLSRKFKEEMGTGVGDYIRYARVERAKSLLAYTDEPVSQIAEELRFCSGSHFSQVFRSVTGMLPAQYRRSMRKG